jgi:peptidylprolyl isomerase
MTRAKPGDKVMIHLVGRTSDGAVFETTEGQKPLEVKVGSDRLIPGLRDAVVGMLEGEERKVLVSPENGYGLREQKVLREVPVHKLPQGASEGDKLYARIGEDVIEVWVRDISEKKAVLDENHPLAGETLEFDVKLVSVNPDK